MAKPNYSFEKRQRDLAKKKKKEEKLQERAARKNVTSGVTEPGTEPVDSLLPEEDSGAAEVDQAAAPGGKVAG